MSETKGTSAVGARLSGLAKVGQGFKDFIARGNVVDLAVGVVIGAAFGKVVTAFVEAVLNPLIGWIFGQPNLDNIWNIGPYTWDKEADAQAIQVGVVLTQVLNFVLTAAAIYFFIVLPLNALAARRKKGDEPEPAAPAEDILLLQEIRDLLASRPNPATANDTGSPATPPPPTYPPTV
ncbi:large conductance mechanosensitive channel protein MscL [Cellulomonas sp. PhB150]|uniref:large conductance mechanosensitive channel protein MscL n=1 Tax=Cellulomonas sp. PhB150 TaxID=2485188 RepID=UPI000F941952|nr:large conductance mechanosensitive channel protein MscL [Cellulomonas sp. PhB150]ROS21843.1 large conductance mechanosensitive channel [Cellulomonas sp. PhB150]